MVIYFIIFLASSYRAMNQSYKFVSPPLENVIRSIILPSIFPALNIDHRDLLCKYTIRLINIIAICFGFYSDIYINQLKQNDYQDIRWLVAYLLPFLNENNDIGQITFLDEIYTKKRNM
jgi:hypothetical protein